jgi:hypothetical protein
MKEQRSGPRFRFDHVRPARMMGIDGTWQRECTARCFRWRHQAHGRRFDRGATAQRVLPGAVVDGTGLSALQAGLGERRPDRRDLRAAETGEANEGACGSRPPLPVPGRLRPAPTRRVMLYGNPSTDTSIGPIEGSGTGVSRQLSDRGKGHAVSRSERMQRAVQIDPAAATADDNLPADNPAGNEPV